MKKTTKQTIEDEVITDITCDICGISTRINDDDWSDPFSYGKLTFSGGWGSTHDMERVDLDLCEACLFDIAKRRISGTHNVDGFDIPPGRSPDKYISECFAQMNKVSQK